MLIKDLLFFKLSPDDDQRSWSQYWLDIGKKPEQKCSQLNFISFIFKLINLIYMYVHKIWYTFVICDCMSSEIL